MTERGHIHISFSIMEDFDHSSEDVNLEITHQKYNSISQEKRILFLKYYAENKNVAKSAKFFNLKLSTTYSIIRNEGRVKKRGGSFHKKVNLDILDFLENQVTENPTVNLKVLKEALLESKHINLCLSAISNNLVFTTKLVKRGLE